MYASYNDIGRPDPEEHLRRQLTSAHNQMGKLEKTSWGEVALKVTAASMTIILLLGAAAITAHHLPQYGGIVSYVPAAASITTVALSFVILSASLMLLYMRHRKQKFQFSRLSSTLAQIQENLEAIKSRADLRPPKLESSSSPSEGSSSNKEVEQLREQKAALEEEITRLQEQIVNIKSDRDTLDLAQETMASNLRKHFKATQEKDAEIRQGQETIRGLNEKIEVIEVLLAEYETKIEQLQGEVSTLRGGSDFPRSSRPPTIRVTPLSDEMTTTTTTTLTSEEENKEPSITTNQGTLSTNEGKQTAPKGRKQRKIEKLNAELKKLEEKNASEWTDKDEEKAKNLLLEYTRNFQAEVRKRIERNAKKLNQDDSLDQSLLFSRIEKSESDLGQDGDKVLEDVQNELLKSGWQFANNEGEEFDLLKSIILPPPPPPASEVSVAEKDKESQGFTAALLLGVKLKRVSDEEKQEDAQKKEEQGGILGLLKACSKFRGLAANRESQSDSESEEENDSEWD